MKLKSGFLPLALALTVSTASYGAQKNESEKVIDIVNKVNQHWQENNKAESSAFWHNAAYHTGNMEAYFLTGNDAYREYSDRLRVVDTVFGKPPDREFLTLYRHHDSSLFHAAVSPGCIFFNRISTFFHRLCIITSRPDHMRGSDVCTVLYIIVILPSDTSCAFARVLLCLMVF